jgi:GNAT superfamily N-acetyltransferase
MESFIIRLAVLSEKETLEALQLRASLTNARDRDAILANPDAIEIPFEQLSAGRVFIAEKNGAIAGFAAIEPRSDGDAELDALFVDPTIRRLGIGRLLVEHCASIARKNGSAALHVIGNPHAEEFYRASGFEQTGITKTRFGVGLLFRKDL